MFSKQCMYPTVTASLFVFTQGRFSQSVLVIVHCYYNNIILAMIGLRKTRKESQQLLPKSWII